MKYLDNSKFIQIDQNNLSGKFLKDREYLFTKNKISVFANKLFMCFVVHSAQYDVTIDEARVMAGDCR